MSAETLHEPLDQLSEHTLDMHRAIRSLMEELEAVDWYSQRADATKDSALKAVLLHNRNEEVEHAIMTLEWIRRQDEVFDRNMKTYLFAEGEITEIEKNEAPEKKPGKASRSTSAAKPGREASKTATFGSLGIGSLKEG